MLHYAAASGKTLFSMSDNPVFQPLKLFDREALRDVRVLLADIDDTLTTDGKLTGEAYTAMEQLSQIGIHVAPVTGRPAGWCDHIARMWPVVRIVGENGAFYYNCNDETRRMMRVYAQDDATRRANRQRLERLATEILSAVPGVAISADQFARDTDLAIDFCEDVTPLPQSYIDRIVAVFEAAGATAKVSSIHVNGWFGDHDKLTMARRFLNDVLSIDVERENTAVAYIGDSPNDAPMWRYFKNSIGVANALAYKGRLAAEPKYVTTRESGAGFMELAEALIDAAK